MMTCFYCKGAEKPGTTAHVVKLKTSIIIVKNVPCTECSQCGAAFYSNDVALQLEKIVKDLKTATTEVAIINYLAA